MNRRTRAGTAIIQELGDRWIFRIKGAQIHEVSATPTFSLRLSHRIFLESAAEVWQTTAADRAFGVEPRLFSQISEEELITFRQAWVLRFGVFRDGAILMEFSNSWQLMVQRGASGPWQLTLGDGRVFRYAGSKDSTVQLDESQYARFERAADRVILRARETTVVELRTAPNFHVLLSNGLTLDYSGDVMQTVGNTWPRSLSTVDADELTSTTPLSWVVFPTGEQRIVFSNGWNLAVNPSPDDSWRLDLGDGQTFTWPEGAAELR